MCPKNAQTKRFRAVLPNLGRYNHLNGYRRILARPGLVWRNDRGGFEPIQRLEEHGELSAATATHEQHVFSRALQMEEQKSRYFDQTQQNRHRRYVLAGNERRS